jgi:uncharacterized membrane protein
MIRDDLLDMKKEVKELKEQTFALSLLSDMKRQNRHMFIIILVILGMFTALLGYTLYLLNDIGTIEETTSTQEISDIDTINNSSINNGGK